MILPPASNDAEEVNNLMVTYFKRTKKLVKKDIAMSNRLRMFMCSCCKEDDCKECAIQD